MEWGNTAAAAVGRTIVDIKLGEQTFVDVQIPLLWGTRAISQDRNGCLSVVDLSGGTIKIEIIGDRPVPGVPSVPSDDGFEILSNGKPAYRYNPEEKTLTSLSLGLPECQVGQGYIRVGPSVFEGNVVAGFGVGIIVTESSVTIGAPLPPGLEELAA
jgi:hypothetical protein